LIPTPVKVEVWRGDRGQWVQCGSTKNLHFDHDIPFSEGGSSPDCGQCSIALRKM
jgi:5-methylcytosine-specific restriction endonuclease McrA